MRAGVLLGLVAGVAAQCNFNSVGEITDGTLISTTTTNVVDECYALCCDPNIACVGWDYAGETCRLFSAYTSVDTTATSYVSSSLDQECCGDLLIVDLPSLTPTRTPHHTPRAKPRGSKHCGHGGNCWNHLPSAVPGLPKCGHGGRCADPKLKYTKCGHGGECFNHNSNEAMEVAVGGDTD